MNKAITTMQYGDFQKAFDFFNAQLFGGSLPHVMVTLQRHARARGYFSPDRFAARGGKTTVHELAMNPDAFVDRTDEQILSTLVHEMAHLWQQTHGRAPRRAYHDREWAVKMKEIGLHPSDTGEVGGKETGQNMTHYIVADGRYARSYAKLAAQGLKLQWESPSGDGAAQAKAKRESKTKYTCPTCEQNAWAKPGAVLICGDCYEDDPSDPQTLLAAS